MLKREHRDLVEYLRDRRILGVVVVRLVGAGIALLNDLHKMQYTGSNIPF